MKGKLLILISSISYISLLFLSITISNEKPALLMTDVSQLMPVKIAQVVEGKEEESIKKVLMDAKTQNIKVSIAGKRHSMGGHTYYKDGIVLDMTSYNRILDFNPENKTIRVQSGATWADIQHYINPFGLSIKVMQSQNIFTVGGSLSVNAHGRDIRYGSLIDTVLSFRLLQSNGKIINVSRDENEELFHLVISGYGLFGVILDVELELTDDELYMTESKSLGHKEYSQYFIDNIQKNDRVRMHLARISTAPDNFLTNMYVTNYVLSTDQLELTKYNELKGERMTWLTKFMLGLSRNYDWGKNLLWNSQEKYFLHSNGTFVSRNNVMRSESKFLEYENENNTDVLQEYFVPVQNFTAYIDDLRETLSNEEFNLFNITIRYVQKNEDAVLSYAKDDMFALVLLINQGFLETEKEATKVVIQKLIDVTLKHDGSYYLPYMPYPTKDQMRRAYPQSNVFFEKKLQYDPEELFFNYFYEEYK